MAALLHFKDDCPEIIARRAEDGMKVREDFFELFSEDIQEASKLLALAFSGERRVLICGCGTSGAMASILAGRFLGTSPSGRSPLPALLLQDIHDAGDTVGSQLSLGAFARQIEAFGSDGDVLVLFSASGNEPLLAEAARTAKDQGMFILGITGGDGGILGRNDLLDLELRIPSIEESLIHELHAALACLLTELTDYYLYTKPEILREIFQQRVSDLQDELAGD